MHGDREHIITNMNFTQEVTVRVFDMPLAL